MNETIKEIHDKANQEGKSGYIDPISKRFVLTENFLLKRGHCCDRDCRHCPYKREMMCHK